MQIEWKDIYKTGNDPIDNQHRQWFNKVNYFLEATDKDGRFVAARKLLEYTRLHFEHEEELMRRTNYPDAKLHTRRHVETLIHMELLVEQVADEALVLEKWKEFLSELFRNHMGSEDLKLAAFVTGHKRALKKGTPPGRA